MATEARHDRARQRYEDGARLVACAVPLRCRDGCVLLVSGRTGDWVFPKGGWDEGESAEEAAAREAWEEAGVRGEVGPELWRGRVEKGSPSKATLWVVFPLFVRESAHEWPESAIRDRIWVPPADAAALLRRPHLADLLQRAVAALRGSPPFADGTLSALTPTRVFAPAPGEAGTTFCAVVHADGDDARRARQRRHAACTGKPRREEARPAEGHHPRTALVSLQPEPLRDAEAVAALLARARVVERTLENDRYASLRLALPGGLLARAELTFPATEDEVARAGYAPARPFVETAADYRERVEPRVAERAARRTAWVRNIVEGRAETERVILRAARREADGEHSTGFVLLPGMRSSGGDDGESAQYLAVVDDPALRTLRDLRGHHLPLLRRLRDECAAALGDDGGRRCAFLHYPPSFEWLHVHFRELREDFSARDHLLGAVIANLEADGDHYARCALTYARTA